MNASIVESITDNIVTALQAMTTGGGYDFAPGAVEQERSELNINNRYPFIEVSGPSATVNQGEHTRGDRHTLEYVITYLDDISDKDVSNDNPLPKQTASIVANMHKALMVDYTRNGNAIMTTLREYGYVNFSGDEGDFFQVYMTVEVEAIIDSFDMSLLG